MSKQYGLIIPGQQKKAATAPIARPISKPSIFDESSDSDQEAKTAKLIMKTVPIEASAMQRRMARFQQQKALKEDPTIYQYDEVFDEIEAKRESEKQTKSNEPKKSKYIGRLMEQAERRKLDNERRIERQVQLEREQEGEEFKDKESFVTAAYRKKLEELRTMDEQEKRDDYLEAIGDVTKQKDLGGFYRHLYEQKLGTPKEVQKPELSTTEPKPEELYYKPIKSLKTQRAYRKRRSSAADDNEEEKTDAGDAEPASKRTHIQSNIDADSDFSIDSSSSDDEQDTVIKSKSPENVKTIQSTKKDDSTTAHSKQDKDDNLDLKEGNEDQDKNISIDDQRTTPSPQPVPKKDKSEIWKKRTVGDVFDAAVKRYFERKAARCA